jgi:hypothetical protein
MRLGVDAVGVVDSRLPNLDTNAELAAQAETRDGPLTALRAMWALTEHFHKRDIELEAADNSVQIH